MLSAKRAFFIFSIFVLATIAGLVIWSQRDPDVRLVIEKMVTQAVMPYGLACWACLLATVRAAYRRDRISTVCVGAATILLFVFGCGYLADALLRSLEHDYIDVQPFDSGTYDAIIVLGGGTTEGRNGVAQAHLAGDRVLLAARMYHAGLAPTIYCTGNRIESISNDQWDPWEEAHLILQDLGVPADALRHVEGRNTAEEMKNLGAAPELDGKRVGLITSAWHLKRSERLAKRNNLTVEPLPADFYSTPSTAFNPIGMVPSSVAAQFNQVALREYLGMLVGR
ncbi:MAG: YdcF family protein [Planctomycetales bacterium]|nr:YdcF family protein [Planctomycetales bacterium]